MQENESIPSGSEAVEAESVEIHEDASMLDVHPPHGALHGWKDFWIHLGTITLGLLIAISLEQTVEWLHHLHQRHQLEADLRQEGIQNLNLSQEDVQVMDERMGELAAKLREVESTIAVRKKMPPSFAASSFTVPPRVGDGFFAMPLETVWTTAKESALIDLLPKETARAYTRVYYQIDLLHTARTDSYAGGRVIQGYECRFSDGTLPCKAGLARMTNEQLEEYAGLLAGYFPLIQEMKLRVLFFEATNSQMVNTGSAEGSNEELLKLRAAHPDTFLVPTPGPK